MADKKDISQRVFVGFMAFLFLGTALATGIAVIISSASNHNNTSTSPTPSASATAYPAADLTKLAGTKLANFTPVSNVSTLGITDTKVGTGAVATANDTVEVLYVGAVASTGIIFQASTDSSPQPVSIPLNEVIQGWQKGIPGMKVGGVRRLLIPASEAYGANPPSGSNIPVNAPLVFDITLLAVKQ